MRLSSSSSSSGFNHQPQEGMDFLYALFGSLVSFLLVKFITFVKAFVNSLSLYVCVYPTHCPAFLCMLLLFVI